MEYVAFFEATKLIKVKHGNENLENYTCILLDFFFIPRSMYYPEDYKTFYSNIAGLKKKTYTHCPKNASLDIEGAKLSGPHKPLNMIVL